MMAGKLGLASYVGEADAELIDELHRILEAVETDMTIFFRRLADVGASGKEGDAELLRPLKDAFYVDEQIVLEYRNMLLKWLRTYQSRVRKDGRSDEDRRKRMNAMNPKYVLRNYMAQLAIDQAEKGEFTQVAELLELLRHPYEEQPDREKYAARRPDWARNRAGCSMLSCSS